MSGEDIAGTPDECEPIELGVDCKMTCCCGCSFRMSVPVSLWAPLVARMRAFEKRHAECRPMRRSFE